MTCKNVTDYIDKGKEKQYCCKCKLIAFLRRHENDEKTLNASGSSAAFFICLHRMRKNRYRR